MVVSGERARRPERLTGCAAEAVHTHIRKVAEQANPEHSKQCSRPQARKGGDASTRHPTPACRCERVDYPANVKNAAAAQSPIHGITVITDTTAPSSLLVTARGMASRRQGDIAGSESSSRLRNGRRRASSSARLRLTWAAIRIVMRAHNRPRRCGGEGREGRGHGAGGRGRRTLGCQGRPCGPRSPHRCQSTGRWQRARGTRGAGPTQQRAPTPLLRVPAGAGPAEDRGAGAGDRPAATKQRRVQRVFAAIVPISLTSAGFLEARASEPEAERP